MTEYGESESTGPDGSTGMDESTGMDQSTPVVDQNQNLGTELGESTELVESIGGSLAAMEVSLADAGNALDALEQQIAAGE